MDNFDAKLDAKINLFLADYYEFEELIKRLPVTVQNELKTVIVNIQALSKALDVIPEQFDIEFNRKINKVLDVAQEIDVHTQMLERMLKVEIPDLLAKHEQDLLANKKEQGLSTLELAGFGAACGLVGGIIGSSLLMIVIYLM
ncbi:hypothetical protein OAA_18555 [Vibrio cyclitrophicus 1F175]|uniref:hypothetical protein n=1 Tax=Vibrio TaxID=662 RepID=UPI00030DFCD7|nr:hypothetical protein [Vibrio cyclitrophicus]OEF62205.1 hypothetical protein OAA_18555 [Vibrio cyclitrophicus 1F175]